MRYILPLFLLVSTPILSLNVHSATWICGNDNWNTNYWYKTCWDAWDYPDAGETVYLVDTIFAYEKTVNYVNPSYNPKLGTLYIESTGGQVTTLNIAQDDLTTTATVIGIVSSGYGAITQSGGIHTADDLMLGRESFSVGNYTLEGTGILMVNNDEDIGYWGNAYFTQNGGTHTVTGKLTFGVQPSGTSWGEYTLNDGSLTAFDEELGRRGRGDFYQYGGSHTVTNDFTVGFLQRGRYELFNGTLTVGTGRIGYFDLGYFTQYGGTHVAETIIVQADPGAYGEFTMNGGTLRANTISNNGLFDFNGGTVNVGTFNGDLVNDGGQLAPRASPGTATIEGNYTHNTGSLFIQIGGLNSNNEHDYDRINVVGALTINGATLQVVLINNYVPAAGQRFDVLDWSSLSGSFGYIDLTAAALPGSLFWDTSRLYTYGELTVGSPDDTDSDSVGDYIDNCILVPNPTQCDGDRDGYGNHCDADFNNDLIVNGLDIGLFKAGFGTTDVVTDLNCDGITNGLDIGLLKVLFGSPPGPSGLVP